MLQIFTNMYKDLSNFLIISYTHTYYKSLSSIYKVLILQNIGLETIKFPVDYNETICTC